MVPGSAKSAATTFCVDNPGDCRSAVAGSLERELRTVFAGSVGTGDVGGTCGGACARAGPQTDIARARMR